MKESKNVVWLKNSGIGFLAYFVSFVFQFVCRKVLLDFIGVEILGLSSTFTSILNALSLAELGFQNAIVYSLYIPLNKGDKDGVNDVVNIFKFVYRCVAIFIATGAMLVLPFLKYFVVGIEWGNHIYIIFLLQATSIVMSYCMAYRRSLLYADQRDYVAKLVDMISNIFFSVLIIVTTIYMQNYYLYLVLKILQVILSNIIVNVYCIRKYDYLHKTELNRNKLKEILVNVKEIFIARMAGYVYSSTDSLVISKFISTVTVGYLVNYTTVTLAIRNLAESFLKPIIPIIGRKLNNDIMKQGDEKELFETYTHIRFLIACIIVIPVFVLTDEFIRFVFGSQYVLSKVIILLLCAEMFIYFSHGGATVFVNGKGLFKQEKRVEIIGAVSNLATSIILANVIGLPGVLLGTVFSQLLYAVGRSRIVYKYILIDDKSGFVQYWFNALYQLIVFLIAAILCYNLCDIICFDNPIMQFICRGLLAEIIICAICFLSMIIRKKHRRYLMSLYKIIIRRD